MGKNEDLGGILATEISSKVRVDEKCIGGEKTSFCCVHSMNQVGATEPVLLEGTAAVGRPDTPKLKAPAL